MNFREHILMRCKEIPSGVVIDYENELFTSYIYNLSGQVIGFQQYNWRGSKKVFERSKMRYWTYITKQDKCSSAAVLGLQGVNTTEPLYLVEGQFEAYTGQSYGINCVAVLCNNPKPLKNWLYSYPREVIALCQNDSAGLKLSSLADKSIILPKDLDELTQKEVSKIVDLKFQCLV